jgi:endonuclease/exonuclease/phosphatase family metal-dependent hydrolase
MKLLVAAGDSNSKPAAAGYRLPANTISKSTTSTAQHVLVSVQRRLSDAQASKSPHTT